MSYINTDYYYEQISALASELIDEVEGIMNENADGIIRLYNKTPLTINGKKLVSLIFEEDDYGDLEITLCYENGETELFRELNINNMLIIADHINNLD